MLRKAAEVHNNSREQVMSYLTDALAIVEELDPPEDLRQACFTQALAMLSSKQVQYEQVNVGMPRMAIPGQG